MVNAVSFILPNIYFMKTHEKPEDHVGLVY